MKKYDKFPAKVYVDTFLKPDLHIYKTVFKDALFQINYAQCIMLKEQKIISDEEAKIIFKNLNEIENEFDFPYCDEDGLEESSVESQQPISSDFPYPIVIAFAFIILIPILIWIVWGISLRGKSSIEKQYINMMRLATLGGIPINNTQTPIEYGMNIGTLLPSIRESVSYITWNFAAMQYSDAKVELNSSDADSNWKKIRKALLARILSFKFITNKLT